ncbi:GlxA family transcriptional regulator [Thalassospira marina]|uniref:AraC family transcriptional regulator n=1 Tax=Thalassospira marina TaxID=2048283 RepID=A0A2N3KTE7_9PROT|nr:DJ-1/PfpI family protein [Thalassospira marina]PKR53811.1 AraC family transcriptional regulator [Thalassospira marina]
MPSSKPAQNHASAGQSARTIAIFAADGVQMLDVSGPMDVFAEANRQLGRVYYDLKIISENPGPLAASSGVKLLPDLTIDETGNSNIDTLLVAGAPHADQIMPSIVLQNWLTNMCQTTRRYGSVCSGAFFLAHAGLLNKRRVTTHWSVADTLKRCFPDIILDIDAIHTRDGRLRTAAGVTAGMDLALALVNEDLGSALAQDIAAQLVMFFKRPGGQMQFRRNGAIAPTGRAALQEVQRWVSTRPDLKHTVASLAERTGLSPRHFARLFHDEVGITPADWIENVRVEHAKTLFHDGNFAPKQVASLCGFNDIDTFRRAFVRRVGITPADYRKRHAITRAD